MPYNKSTRLILYAVPIDNYQDLTRTLLAPSDNKKGHIMLHSDKLLLLGNEWQLQGLTKGRILPAAGCSFPSPSAISWPKYF